MIFDDENLWQDAHPEREEPWKQPRVERLADANGRPVVRDGRKMIR
jgi:hypothetical protein